MGIAVVAELRPGELMYQHRRSASSFAPVGDNEDPRLYPSVQDAEPETQLYAATRVVLWVNSSITIQSLAAVLAYNGRMSASSVGELVFDLTGSDQQAQDAEAAAEYGKARSDCKHWADKASEFQTRPYIGIFIAWMIMIAVYIAFVGIMYVGDLLSGAFWQWDGISGAATWAKLLLFGLGALVLLYAPIYRFICHIRLASIRRSALAAWPTAEPFGADADRLLHQLEDQHSATRVLNE